MDDCLLDYDRYRPHGSLGLMTRTISPGSLSTGVRTC